MGLCEVSLYHTGKA